MKIAILSSHTPSLFWFRMDMMKNFIEKGHTVVAIGNEPCDKWATSFAAEGIKYIQADIQRNGTNPLNDLKTLKSLKNILAEEKPDKIFTYQAKTVIYGSIAAHKLKIKEIYPLIAGVGSVFLNNGLKAKIVRTILKTEYKISLKYADKVFFQNHDDVDLFTTEKMVKPEKVVMINGSGVSLEKFIMQPLPEKPSFLYIGRLIKDKGIHEYLEAAKAVKKNYPDVRFLLVGPFDTNPTALTEAELQTYTDEGIIEYFGEQSDVRPYLAQCSIYVLPSYREGTPKTVLEAMASGKAVITTDAPGCRETVINGKNGYLVPVKDVNAVAEKMTELITSPETVKQMAAEGRKLAEEKFDVKIVNEKINETMRL